MQKIMRYLSMAALAVVGAMISSCTSDDLATETPQPKVNNTVTLTTTISLDGGAQTRALTSAGVKTFAKDDKIALIYTTSNGETVNIVSDPITAENIFDDGKKAKVIFDGLSGNPEADQDARLIYPAAMAKTTIDASAKINDDNTIDFSKLAVQDGTLASLADNLDLCTWDGQLNELQPEFDTSKLNFDNMPNLTNRLTIGEFTIKDGKGTATTTDDKDITSTIVCLSVGDGTNNYFVNRTEGAGPIYVAMLPISNKTVTVNATINNNNDLYYYSKEVTGVTLQKNYLYPINVTTAEIDAPLTLEAIYDGGTISFRNKAAGPVTYRINGLAVPAYTIASGETKEISVDEGDKVTFFGDNPRYEPGYGGGGTNSLIECTDDCYVYGNIMSLVSSTGYTTATELKEDYTFTRLFEDNRYIKNHPSKELKLPATTLTSDCYKAMFRSCKSLTKAPELPAGKDGKGKIASWCYDYMFAGCEGLTVAPELPAMTLDRECYYAMFSGCNNLTTAVLPATKLEYGCYEYMFDGCTKLSSVSCYAKDISAGGCLINWLEGAGTEATNPALYVKAGLNLPREQWNIPDSWAWYPSL